MQMRLWWKGKGKENGGPRNKITCVTFVLIWGVVTAYNIHMVVVFNEFRMAALSRGSHR